MDNSHDPLEQLWDQILSRDPETIKAAFKGLSPEQQATVVLHLEKMAYEPGWHDEQRESARVAIEALQAGSAR